MSTHHRTALKQNKEWLLFSGFTNDTQHVLVVQGSVKVTKKFTLLPLTRRRSIVKTYLSISVS